MLRKLAIVSLFAFLTPLNHAAQDATPASPQPWTEHYRKATVCLGRLLVTGKTQSFDMVGTGVIVSPDGKRVFLVTAKHVFNEPSQSWHPSELRVRFSSQETKSFSEELGKPVQLTASNGTNLWSALPDASDLAAIRIDVNAFGGLVTDAIGFQDFAKSDDVYDGATVFVLGYPGDVKPLIGQEDLVRAVTRSGVIAWTDPSGATDNALLIDANVLPGNSGGPALKMPTGVNKYGAFEVGGRVAFLGIVTADLGEYYVVKADGRVVQVQYPDLPHPSIAQVAVVGIGGLGRVEPASKVKKLIDSMQ